MTKKSTEYDASSIQFLKDLEGVRKRPAMYIGDTAFSGFHHLLWEIVDNSVDEALAGECDLVTVTLNKDGSATVVDNGRGIPVEMHPEGMPTVELVMTKLHAGGKFDNDAYAVSGGLHGVGISVVNALSEITVVDIYKDGLAHQIEFSRGYRTKELKTCGKTDFRGTKVTFLPDQQIFQHDVFDYDTIKHRLREMSYLMGTTGLRIVLEDERTGEKDEFYHPDGLVSYIGDLTEGKEPISDIVHFCHDVEWEGKNYNVEVAMRYSNDWNEGIFSFVNNIRTADGGTHLSGYRSGLTRTLNAHMRKADLLKKGEAPSGEDYRAGLYAVISVKIPDPQFEGQTKGKLGSREVASIVEGVMNRCLGDYLEMHPETGRAIIRKAFLSRDAREAAKKQRDLVRRKGALSSGSLPGKLADCQSKDTTVTELYVVEGDSAGGSAKTGRDRRYQAILPLKGKILNVEKNTANRILANQELQTMIQAIGANVGDEFNIEKVRYGKIIIMTDADVDGSHIRTLILTFLFRQMRPLVEGGRVFVSCPPLYRIQKKGAKAFEYLHDDNALRKAINEWGLGSVSLSAPNGVSFQADEVRSLMAHTEGLRIALKGLRGDRKGVDAAAYLGAWKMDEGLPSWLVVSLLKSQKNYHFFWSEQERDNFLNSLATEKVWAGAQSAIPRDSAEVLCFSFPERERAMVAIQALIDLGIPMDTSKIPGGGLCVENGRFSKTFSGIPELGAVLREAGQSQVEVQRYKGLGEMNPDQLWESTMDPEHRTLKRIILEDAYEADRIFSMLMGDETEPRRNYIEEHAHEIENLDI